MQIALVYRSRCFYLANYWQFIPDLKQLDSFLPIYCRHDQKFDVNNKFIPNVVVCPQNYYDTDCSIPCGKCKGDDVCLNVTGHCPRGCKQHWKEPKCDGKLNKLGKYSLELSDINGNCL